MIKNFDLTINNFDDGALDRKYIIVSLVDGELWYYDAGDDLDKCRKVISNYPEKFILTNK